MATVGELVAAERLRHELEGLRKEALGGGLYDEPSTTAHLLRLGIWDAEVYEATFSDDDRAMSFFAHDGSDVIYDMYLRGELRKDRRVKVIVIPQEEE